MHYCYILRCSDDTLYTGYTVNVGNRLKVHNSGKGAKYTRARIPCELVYVESYEDKSLAMKREYEIKKKSRKEKLDLIRYGIQVV